MMMDVPFVEQDRESPRVRGSHGVVSISEKQRHTDTSSTQKFFMCVLVLQISCYRTRSTHKDILLSAKV